MNDSGSSDKKDSNGKDGENTESTDKRSEKRKGKMPSWFFSGSSTTSSSSEKRTLEKSEPQQSIGISGFNRLREMVSSRTGQSSQHGPDSSVPQEPGSSSSRVYETGKEILNEITDLRLVSPLKMFKTFKRYKDGYQEYNDDSGIRTRDGIGGTVPENFHNRRLLATIADANNCAIDAIAISNNPNLGIEQRMAIVTGVRDLMVATGYVDRNEQIDVNHIPEGGDMSHGQMLLEVMSIMGYVGENCGLTVHYSHHQGAMSDHNQAVPGDHQIHIYLENCRPVQHFWGMGPEIEPGAWAPDTDVPTMQQVISESRRTTEEEQLLETLERSLRER